jgi:hypothetical protein
VKQSLHRIHRVISDSLSILLLAPRLFLHFHQVITSITKGWDIEGAGQECSDMPSQSRTDARFPPEGKAQPKPTTSYHRKRSSAYWNQRLLIRKQLSIPATSSTPFNLLHYLHLCLSTTHYHNIYPAIPAPPPLPTPTYLHSTMDKPSPPSTPDVADRTKLSALKKALREGTPGMRSEGLDPATTQPLPIPSPLPLLRHMSLTLPSPWNL